MLLLLVTVNDPKARKGFGVSRNLILGRIGKMLKNKLMILIGVAVIFVAFASVQAAQWTGSAVADGQFAVRATPFPLEPRSITQSK